MAQPRSRRLSISRRAASLPYSPIRKLNSFRANLKKRGISVLHLNIGQSDLPTPKRFYQAMRGYNQRVLSYAPSNGYYKTIGAWQKYYSSVGIRFRSDEIIITTGGSEAIQFAFSAVADPGDELLVFEPLYPNYLAFAKLAGIKLKPVALSISNGFHPPSDKEIISKITPRTRGIIVCNPSNPTGTVLTIKELKRIADIARRFNLFIIADEAYREFVFDGNKTRSLMSFPSVKQQVILVDSVSKRFNVCGARIGCIASKNREIMEAASKFAQGRLSSPMYSR